MPVAVVTGGNRGVGREVCRQLALLGFGVVLGSRDLRKGELAAKELDPEGVRIVACQLEVDNSISVAAMADWVKERFGRTDVLINNASTMYDRWATASNADLGTVAEAIDVNLFGLQIGAVLLVAAIATVVGLGWMIVCQFQFPDFFAGKMEEVALTDDQVDRGLVPDIEGGDRA